MIDLAALWATYGSAIQTGVAGAGGWYANMVRLRLGRDRARLDAGNQAMAILDRARQSEEHQGALLSDLIARVSVLMRQRWQSDDALQDLYAHAISARLTIQELDAQAGRPPRVFPPLPPYPYPPIDHAGVPDGGPAAEVAAADKAEPCADDTHG